MKAIVFFLFFLVSIASAEALSRYIIHFDHSKFVGDDVLLNAPKVYAKDEGLDCLISKTNATKGQGILITRKCPPTLDVFKVDLTIPTGVVKFSFQIDTDVFSERNAVYFSNILIGFNSRLYEEVKRPFFISAIPIRELNLPEIIKSDILLDTAEFGTLSLKLADFKETRLGYQARRFEQMAYKDPLSKARLSASFLLNNDEEIFDTVKGAMFVSHDANRFLWNAQTFTNDLALEAYNEVFSTKFFAPVSNIIGFSLVLDNPEGKLVGDKVLFHPFLALHTLLGGKHIRFATGELVKESDSKVTFTNPYCLETGCMSQSVDLYLCQDDIFTAQGEKIELDINQPLGTYNDDDWQILYAALEKEIIKVYPAVRDPEDGPNMVFHLIAELVKAEHECSDFKQEPLFYLDDEDNQTKVLTILDGVENVQLSPLRDGSVQAFGQAEFQDDLFLNVRGKVVNLPPTQQSDIMVGLLDPTEFHPLQLFHTISVAEDQFLGKVGRGGNHWDCKVKSETHLGTDTVLPLVNPEARYIAGINDLGALFVKNEMLYAGVEAKSRFKGKLAGLPAQEELANFSEANYFATTLFGKDLFGYCSSVRFFPTIAHGETKIIGLRNIWDEVKPDAVNSCPPEVGYSMKTEKSDFEEPPFFESEKGTSLAVAHVSHNTVEGDEIIARENLFTLYDDWEVTFFESRVENKTDIFDVMFGIHVEGSGDYLKFVSTFPDLGLVKAFPVLPWPRTEDPLQVKLIGGVAYSSKNIVAAIWHKSDYIFGDVVFEHLNGAKSAVTLIQFDLEALKVLSFRTFYVPGENIKLDFFSSPVSEALKEVASFAMAIKFLGEIPPYQIIMSAPKQSKMPKDLPIFASEVTIVERSWHIEQVLEQPDDVNKFNTLKLFLFAMTESDFKLRLQHSLPNGRVKDVSLARQNVFVSLEQTKWDLKDLAEDSFPLGYQEISRNMKGDFRTIIFTLQAPKLLPPVLFRDMTICVKGNCQLAVGVEVGSLTFDEVIFYVAPVNAAGVILPDFVPLETYTQKWRVEDRSAMLKVNLESLYGEKLKVFSAELFNKYNFLLKEGKIVHLQAIIVAKVNGVSTALNAGPTQLVPLFIEEPFQDKKFVSEQIRIFNKYAKVTAFNGFDGAILQLTGSRTKWALYYNFPEDDLEANVAKRLAFNASPESLAKGFQITADNLPELVTFMKLGFSTKIKILAFPVLSEKVFLEEYNVDKLAAIASFATIEFCFAGLTAFNSDPNSTLLLGVH